MKFGKKDANGKHNQIELELRSPKSPMAKVESTDTRAAQTYEEDFDNGGKSKDTKGKKTKKKGKK